MVEVEIDSIRVSLMSQQRIVILKELESERFLPIWIGPYEAEAITLSLQDVEVQRPLTHDLLRNVLSQLGAEVLRVSITELRDEVFYAHIIIQVNGSPSDPHRGFYFHHGEDATSILEGVSIVGGWAVLPLEPGGGGINCEGASPTIRDCEITFCNGDAGGGIQCAYYSSPMISNCTPWPMSC